MALVLTIEATCHPEKKGLRYRSALRLGIYIFISECIFLFRIVLFFVFPCSYYFPNFPTPISNANILNLDVSNVDVEAGCAKANK